MRSAQINVKIAYYWGLQIGMGNWGYWVRIFNCGASGHGGFGYNSPCRACHEVGKAN